MKLILILLSILALRIDGFAQHRSEADLTKIIKKLEERGTPEVLQGQYFIRAKMRKKSKNLLGAMEDFKNVIQIDSTSENAFLSFLEIIRIQAPQKDQSKVLVICNDMFRIFPERIGSTEYGLRGQVYLKMKNYEASMEDYSKAIELNDNPNVTANFYLALGNLKFLTDQDGCEDYKMALELGHSKPEKVQLKIDKNCSN